MKILDINNVKKTYKGGKQALKGLSLSVNKGEFVAFLGPNGAGKSTLINILSDVVNKTSGSVTLNGYDLDNNKQSFKRSLGVVPQDITFDPFFTPLEALMLQRGLYGLKEDKTYVMGLLKAMGLEDKANAYTRTLSGGMKRRLLIAKAMVHDPEVLILDEPTAGVDVELRQQLWAFLKDLNAKGKTIILTTHYLEEAQELCHKIAIINHGELITYEEKNKLLAKVGSKELLLTVDNTVNNNFKLNGFTCTISNNNIVVKYKEDKDIGDILSQVSSTYKVVSLNMKESSLEEVFLKLIA